MTSFNILNLNLEKANQLCTDFHNKHNYILCSNTRESCVIIHAIIEKIRPRFLVEIGRYRGYSTAQIGYAVSLYCPESRFISIDPHEAAPIGPGWDEHLTNERQAGGADEWVISINNLKKSGMDRYVTCIKDYSQNYINNICQPIDFLFIDGDHRYHAVKNDLELYGSKISKYGIIVLHDVHSELYSPEGTRYGPSLVYNEANTNQWIKHGFLNEVGVLQKL